MQLKTDYFAIKCLSVILTVLFCISAKEQKQSIFKDELEFCEPLNLDFISNLVNEGARNLFQARALPRHKKVRFDLYTRNNPERRQVLETGDRSVLHTSYFNRTWPVRYLIHGWIGLPRTCSNAAIKDAFMATGNYNVIIVDWSDFALDINLFAVIAQSVIVGRQINDFSHFLHEEMGVQYQNIYLIAHSMGCHIAGAAGKLLKPDMYGVIYALDASGPGHSDLPPDQRLMHSDALYVEAIHTDVNLFGIRGQGLAHASFFPNWGLGQPHCPDITTDRIPDFSCDHFAALYYFAESVRNSKAFGAMKCKNYSSMEKQHCSCGRKFCKAQVYMGGDPVIPKRGFFYFSTRKTRPFGYGDKIHMFRPLSPTGMRLKKFN